MNIRIGNDIPMIWRFFTKQEHQKVDYDMEDKDLSLYMTDCIGKITRMPFTVSGNALSFTFYGKDQRRTGEYTFTLVENEGKTGMLTIDKICPLCLVPMQESVRGGIAAGSVSELEMLPLELESVISESAGNDYPTLANKPRINGVVLVGDKSGRELGLTKPYLSLERLRTYLYRLTFDSLPVDNGGDNPVIGGGCSSYVQDGKLYTNLDWDYAETAEFIVRTRDFEGMSFIGGLNDGILDDGLIAQLPYRVRDGENGYGIKCATHILFNDWQWHGCGERSISLTRLPYLILTRVMSMATIATDLQGVLDNVYSPAGLDAMDYLIQIIVTDGTTTYAILPPLSDNQPYVLQDITGNPKMTNFRWVEDSTVDRADLQDRPTGVERFNMMPCALEDLRFTLAYESPSRLSEFIGIAGTDKESSYEALEAIYVQARALYLDRTRDGCTWQTMHSVVYGSRMESLYIQENWNDNCVTDANIIVAIYDAENETITLN